MADLFSVAIHEAAHAVLHVKLGLRLRKNGMVSVEPKDDSLGHINPNYKGKHEDHIKCLLAGGIADHYGTKQTARGLDQDAEQIIHRLHDLIKDDKSLRDAAFALALRAAFGMFSEKEQATQTIEMVRGTVYALCNSDGALDALRMFRVELALNLAQSEWFRRLGALADEARRLVLEHWSVIYALARKLGERGQMSGPEAEAFITGKPFAPLTRSIEEQQLRKQVCNVRNTISRMWSPFCPFGSRKERQAWRRTRKEILLRDFPSADARLQELESQAKRRGWRLPKWRYSCLEKCRKDFHHFATHKPDTGAVAPRTEPQSRNAPTGCSPG